MLELNKIHLGDSYELIKQVPDKSIDLIIVDPPYEIHSHEGGGMLNEKRIQNMMNQLNEKGLDVGINETIFDEFLRVLKVPNIYIWCNKIQLPMYLNEFVNKKGLLFDIIVWNKTNAMPLCGSKYLTDTEYCLYFRKGVKLNTTYDTAKTVYQLPINIHDKNDFEHPTIKPLQIIKNFIINSSNKGDVVLDCFIGSGTTAVASKELGRQYIGMEIDAKWHKIAVDRVNGINAKGEVSLFADFNALEL